MSSTNDRGYAQPDALVSTEWLADHLSDREIRVIESNEDPLLYGNGHIPGAVNIDWTADLNDQVRRDYVTNAAFDALVSRFGITPDTTVVFYGDKNNWWAAYSFWVFQLFGHWRATILDGGRVKWVKEGRRLTGDVPSYDAAAYRSRPRNDVPHRAFRGEVLQAIAAKGQLVDVRSPDEYSGVRLHLADYPNEGALRGGHIPGAVNVPWARAVNTEDGTFKSAEELRAIYVGEKRLDPEQPVISYCRIGERSSHTWFALKYLLGFRNVRNYDGSWTEWGNLVNVPIER